MGNIVSYMFMRLQDYLEQLHRTAETKVGKGDIFEDRVYRSVFSETYIAVNLMIQIWMSEKGYEFSQSGFPPLMYVESDSCFAIDFVLDKRILPSKCEDSCHIIYDINQMVVIPNKETLIKGACAFDEIETWFFEESDSMGLEYPTIKERIFSLVDVIMQSRSITHNDVEKVNPNYEELIALMKTMNGQMIDVKEQMNRMEAKEDHISDQIDELSLQINKLTDEIGDYQKQVSNQLKTVAYNSDEEERIISEFSDRCVLAVEEKMEGEYSAAFYYKEKENLIKLFGSAWKKLDERSKNSLVTARVVYNKMITISSEMDYSGVCLSVSKALEIELKKRFYFMYLDYLEANYFDVESRNPYHDYPSIMLKGEGHTPTPELKFTLGSIPYTIYNFYEKNFSDKYRCQNRLLSYCKDRLFSSKSRDEIWIILQDYASKVSKVKEDYRNPACHTGRLVQTNAKECFDYVLDSEKILKKMLDSFDQ